MGNVIHETVAVRVWADVDVGIADLVRYLNTLPGVRTRASCQGTMGEGGPHPYPAHVTVAWDSPAALARLQAEFDTAVEGLAWGTVFRERRTAEQVVEWQEIAPVYLSDEWKAREARSAIHAAIHAAGETGNAND